MSTAGAGFMAAIRASIILSLFMLLTLPLMPLQALFIASGSSLRRHLPSWYHRLVCGLLQVRVHISGEPPAKGPTLFVSNHISWLDIPVLSSITPLSFIAKQEVAGWPFISWLAKLQRTVFVDRTRRISVKETTGAVTERLNAGERVVLFAEGTSSDGNQVLPFKSSLFAAVEPNGHANEGHVLQTVAIVYTRVYGLPMNRQQRPAVAWYGDMDMVSHAWGVLKGGPLDVHVRFGKPVSMAVVGDRKKLAEHAHECVRSDFSRLITGRSRDVPSVVRPAPVPLAQSAIPAFAEE
jgi:1-acyl-sn-glycerol-3-phosphate acyltransferase